MSFADHFNGVMVVVEELVRQGAVVRVWTDTEFKARIEAAGGEFADLYMYGSMASVDDKSRPSGARGVTFAAAFGEQLAHEASLFGAQLVIHDSFALIGRLVARQLDLPQVIVTAGHAVDAAAFRAALPSNPLTAIDPRCWAAVEILRSKYSIVDASPFSYVGDPSPWLNICKEPAEWVNAEERAFLGPIEHFGALPGDAMDRGISSSDRGGARVYAAFGTIIWRYWQAEAIQAFEAIAEALTGFTGGRLTVGLGGADVRDQDLSRLRDMGVTIHKYADQWAALREADVFVTHHGLGSTHEAVACAVPMLSLPFFWDQPSLARRAQQLGVAVSLIEGAMPGQRLSPDAVRHCLGQITQNHAAMLERLHVARTWEARTIAARPKIARQIMALAS